MDLSLFDVFEGSSGGSKPGKTKGLSVASGSTSFQLPTVSSSSVNSRGVALAEDSSLLGKRTHDTEPDHDGDETIKVSSLLFSLVYSNVPFIRSLSLMNRQM